ncbi:MAG: HEPN domain-containing protein [Anaerolineales bacterium]|nr:HEPN domain-containing protein [Anaerolineales bacterium]MCW5855640.1 HEPN domain-containing protein [Anaerolineales bacterium]
MDPNKQEGPIRFSPFPENHALKGPLLLNIAKGSYVLSRSYLNMGVTLFHYSIVFTLMHHSVETFIKAFLVMEGIVFGRTHALANLLALGAKSERLRFFKTELLDDPALANLFNELSDFYAPNKYGETAYSVMHLTLLRVYDEIVYIFVKNLAVLYPDYSPQIYAFDVPENLLAYFQKHLHKDYHIVVWPEDL